MVQAAICRRFGARLTIEDIVLRPPGAEEVLVDILACAICHSDISFALGEWGGDLPAVYGHEASGRVRQVGDGVVDFRPGDRVLATLVRSCGHCRYCESGSHVLCNGDFAADRTSPIGTANGEIVYQGMRTGAFAEQILVHQSQVVHIPADLPFDQASLIACGGLTGFGAVFNTAGVRAASPVAVVGCGGVGLNVIQSARLAGAAPIIAVDPSSPKREAALSFGATHALDPAESDLVHMIIGLTGGHGADTVLVTVGAKTAIESAAHFLASNGAVVIVGMPASGVMACFEPATLAARNQKILGSKMGDTQIRRDVPAILEAWRMGRFKLEPLISGRYPLDRVNEAMDAVVNGSALRNVIVFEN